MGSPPSTTDRGKRSPTVTSGPFPWPLADEQVSAVLRTAYEDGSWGHYHGPHTAALADALREYFSCAEVQLCCSGTIGLELALRGIGVGPDDEVVLAAYDFPGNFRAVEAVGARPVLVDVDPTTWCLDAEALQQTTGEKIRAVIVSHLHGGVADMPAIVATARERGWAIVEDACQQPGGELLGKRLGVWGDVGVLSFGGSKLLTAGRGGALLSNDPQIMQRIKIFSERGNQAFPLSELQAALLLPQLAQLDQQNRLREERVAQFRQATAELQPWLRPVATRAQSQPAYYKLAWSLTAAETDASLREPLIAALQSAGAPIDAGFRGFAGRSERRCRRSGSLAVSAALSQSTLLLHHPVLLAHKKAALQIADVLIDAIQHQAF